MLAERLGMPSEAAVAKGRGLGFVRAGIALALNKGDYYGAATYAETHYRHSPGVAEFLKSAVSVGMTSVTDWAGALVQSNPLGAEFVAYERPLTILGRLTAARRVPMNISVASGGGTTMAWIGEGSPVPVSKGTFATITLGYSKCGGISVVTRELARLSDPDAERVIRDDLADASTQFLDTAFASPNVAVSGTSPAGILYGISPIISSGTTPALIAADLYSAAASVAAAVTLRAPVWIMSVGAAIYLAALRDSAGGPAFPNIGAMGGELLGVPVLTSGALAHSTSGGSPIIFLESSQLLFADAGALLDASGEAAIQMTDSPSSSATTQVSLFQTNSIGFRLTRYVNWALRRPGAAAYIDSFQH